LLNKHERIHEFIASVSPHFSVTIITQTRPCDVIVSTANTRNAKDRFREDEITSQMIHLKAGKRGDECDGQDSTSCLKP